MIKQSKSHRIWSETNGYKSQTSSRNKYDTMKKQKYL